MVRRFAALIFFVGAAAVAQEKPLLTLKLVRTGVLLLKTNTEGEGEGLHLVVDPANDGIVRRVVFVTDGPCVGIALWSGALQCAVGGAQARGSTETGMRAQMIVLLCVAMTGMLLFGHVTWIYAKAKLAQILLDGAWSRTLEGEQQVKPWRWADTWPVAKIEFPRQHRAFIVLSGASGRAMAFGPGHVDGTAAPGEIGNCVISAHRDTQFAVLHDIDIGDEIAIETRSGQTVRYRVRSIRVVKQRDTAVMADSGDRRLTLITCYPFNAIAPGGDLRYAVVATASS